MVAPKWDTCCHLAPLLSTQWSLKQIWGFYMLTSSDWSTMANLISKAPHSSWKLEVPLAGIRCKTWWCSTFGFEWPQASEPGIISKSNNRDENKVHYANKTCTWLKHIQKLRTFVDLGKAEFFETDAALRTIGEINGQVFEQRKARTCYSCGW